MPLPAKDSHACRMCSDDDIGFLSIYEGGRKAETRVNAAPLSWRTNLSSTTFDLSRAFTSLTAAAVQSLTALYPRSSQSRTMERCWV